MASILECCRFVDFSILSTCLVIHLCSGQSEVTRRMEEMTVSKREKHDAEGTGVLPRAEIVRDEHPLSLGKTSVWNQYFQVTLVNNKITCWWVLHFCIIWFTLECGVWSTIIGIVPYSNC